MKCGDCVGKLDELMQIRPPSQLLVKVEFDDPSLIALQKVREAVELSKTCLVAVHFL